jgi:hypothetical protein
MLLFTLEEFQVYRRAGQLEIVLAPPSSLQRSEMFIDAGKLEIVLAPPSSLLQGSDKSQL